MEIFRGYQLKFILRLSFGFFGVINVTFLRLSVGIVMLLSIRIYQEIVSAKYSVFVSLNFYGIITWMSHLLELSNIQFSWIFLGLSVGNF